MGQYYKPTILGKNKKTVKKWLYSFEYGNGLKLMEHSWIGNAFVSTFENELINNPQIIVWGGDYAENCKNRKSNVYDRCKDKLKISPIKIMIDEKYRYIINHTKKKFIDKTKVPVTNESNGFKWRIHPLPLMTCEGNGLGGGDYRNESDLIGKWSRNLISIESKTPKDYQEILFDLKE